MAQNPRIIAIYRMAEKKNKNAKVKEPYINNANCLINFAATKADVELVVFGDRLKKSQPLAENYADVYHKITSHGNAESFREVLEFALSNYNPDDIIYFVEDDYMHRTGWPSILREGLKIADYVSLYDHPDKYSGTPVKLRYTEHSHWQYAVSTTMTFAATVKTLAFDEPVFEQFVSTGTPADHHLFTTLTTRFSRKLATPIPGYATHGESAWLSPCINWNQ